MLILSYIRKVNMTILPNITVSGAGTNIVNGLYAYQGICVLPSAYPNTPYWKLGTLLIYAMEYNTFMYWVLSNGEVSLPANKPIYGELVETLAPTPYDTSANFKTGTGVLPIPLFYASYIPPEYRTLRILSENRTLIIERENRILEVL